LVFNCGLSHGTIREHTMQELDYSELIQVNLQRNPQLSYPPLEIRNYAWDGDVYNKLGELVPDPIVSLLNKIFTVNGEYYGSLRVNYRVLRHTFVVEINPRTEYAENKFQSFFLSVWDGGNTFLEIEAPLTAKDKVECKNRWGDGLGVLSQTGLLAVGDTTIGSETSIEDDELEEYQRKVKPEDEEKNIDYCTQT